jgi:hypothetical protein
MTSVPGPHLTPDDLDAWLSGVLAPAAQHHLDGCPSCQDRADAEREIVALLEALPLMSPAPGFADRVMTRVARPHPLVLGSLRAAGRRVFATRRSAAIAASLLVLVLGSMTASIVWTLGHQQALAALGGWLAAQAGQAVWLGVRGLASNVIEQPWFAALRNLAAHPGRLGLAVGFASLIYLGGLLALRRLLALPTQRVAHASA